MVPGRKSRVVQPDGRGKQIGSVRARSFQTVAPWQIEVRESVISLLPEHCLLLEPLVLGVCKADIRYISGDRPPDVLKAKLPLAPFHEGVARIAAVGHSAGPYRKGEQVVVIPNVPCYVHDPGRYPSKERACPVCRPGGPGENFCTDGVFLSSTVDGLAQSHVIHPAAAALPWPDAAPLELGALVEPLSVALRALKVSGAQPGNKVAILGAGLMGRLLGLVCSRILGVPRGSLFIADPRRERAESTSAFATPFDGQTVREKLSHAFDLVFECAGGIAAGATISRAIDLLKPGGVCTLVGVSEEPVPIPTRPILDHGLVIRGTTRSAAEDFPAVLDKLESSEFQKLLEAVSSPIAYRGASAAVIIDAARAAAAPETYGKVLIRWGSD